MAKGKASISATGASMSKYDVEVEGRLKALEAQTHKAPTGATQKKVDDRLAALEKAVAEIAAKCDSRASSGSTGGDELTKLTAVVKAACPIAAEKYGL
tara:strand:- start:250 stop:543 length:294 start_codon:yes stop_codon:yes gene_type:complete